MNTNSKKIIGKIFKKMLIICLIIFLLISLRLHRFFLTENYRLNHFSFNNYFFWEDKKIREDLYKLFPVGSDVMKLIDTLRKLGFKVRDGNYNLFEDKTCKIEDFSEYIKKEKSKYRIPEKKFTIEQEKYILNYKPNTNIYFKLLRGAYSFFSLCWLDMEIIYDNEKKIFEIIIYDMCVLNF